MHLTISWARSPAAVAALLCAALVAGCKGDDPQASDTDDMTSAGMASSSSTGPAPTGTTGPEPTGTTGPGATSSTGPEPGTSTGETTGGCDDDAPPASVDEAIDLYAAAWADKDPATRACILARVWATDGRYVDPTADAIGREQLSAVIDAFQGMGELALVLTTQTDVYDEEILRFGWSVVDGQGMVLIEGMDFGRLDSERRLAAITGFFGPFTDPAEVPPPVDDYIAAWNEPDPVQRMPLLASAWRVDGIYRDPMANAEGAEALSGVITGFQQAFPGHSLALASTVDQHHDMLRFRWEIRDADDQPVLDGMDLGQLDEAGRLQRIWGYFGPLVPK